MKSKKAFHHGRGINGGSFSISPNRFQPRSSSPLRNNYIRILLALIVFIFLAWCFPSLTGAIIPSLGVASLLRDDPRISSVRHYDLAQMQGSSRGWERGERILFCAPLRDAAQHLPMFFSHLKNLTYPHYLIDLAFLVSDSKDNTLGDLVTRLDELQADPDANARFGEISIIEKDFGQIVGQSFSDRHGFAAQGSRRKLMARARNWLLSAALRADHSWVYWRDVDVQTAPQTILEDLMRHNKDIIVPNVWRPLPDWLGGEQPYDLNSWQESETALQLAQTLDEDAVIVEGYAEFATWRPHLAYLRDPYGDPEEEMDIDGIGGVSILAKAKVFRAGCHFPAFSFERHAETEGFGKMARRMGYSVIGLPHYVVWHLYEPSEDDLRHMEQMEKERIQREREEADKQREEAGREAASSQWDKDKIALKKASDPHDHGDVEDHDHGGVQGPYAHVGEAIAQLPDPKKLIRDFYGKKAAKDQPSENGITLNDELMGIGGVEAGKKPSMAAGVDKTDDKH